MLGSSARTHVIVDESEPELDDAILISRTRAGDDDAYSELYRRYEYSAFRLARHLGRREEADDVVNEAFARVLDLLQRGKGPTESFRAYLFTTIRHECGARAKQEKRVRPTDDDTQIDSTVEFGAGTLDAFERETVRAAYASLPDRWREVLWALDVDGRKPQEIAALLGLSPNSVSALVYRARAGLREAYLRQHVKAEAPEGDAHTEIRGMFVRVLRRSATARDQERVHSHLASCDACMKVYLELAEDAASVA
jgi:RNA polymerase sigma factor (sigma-70 family)